MSQDDYIGLKRSVVQQLLAGLEGLEGESATVFVQDGIDALHDALEASSSREPAAFFYTRSGRIVSTEASEKLMKRLTGEPGKIPLYTYQPTKRQPLPEEALMDLWNSKFRTWIGGEQFEAIARAIEASHGIKGVE